MRLLEAEAAADGRAHVALFDHAVHLFEHFEQADVDAQHPNMATKAPLRAIFRYRKAAEQDNASAPVNVGRGHEHGKGVAKEDVLAYADYEIAMREGNEKYVSRRDTIARQLTPQQLCEARAPASAWVVGNPMPVRTAAIKDQIAITASLAADASIAAGNDAKGALVPKNRSAPLKYAWRVKGPCLEDPTKTARRRVPSNKYIGAGLLACKTIICADGQVTERMTEDFDVRPRLNYWMARNGRKEQCSGTVTPDACAPRANDAGQLAGGLAIDDVAAGGPGIDVEFNVTPFRAFRPDR